LDAGDLIVDPLPLELRHYLQGAVALLGIDDGFLILFVSTDPIRPVFPLNAQELLDQNRVSVHIARFTGPCMQAPAVLAADACRIRAKVILYLFRFCTGRLPALGL
jgi:hypothetical protein